MRKIQRIRGLATTPKTVTEYADYTGHRGELVSIFDADGKIAEPFLVVHDGVTKGGWKYDNLQVPGGETEGTADTESQSGQSTQSASAQGIPAGWLTESVMHYSAYFDGNSHLYKSFSGGGTSTWTFSAWVKNNYDPNSSEWPAIFAAYEESSKRDVIRFTSDQKINYQRASNGNTELMTDGKYNDPSGWYHIVVQFSDNQQTLYVNGNEAATITSSTNSHINRGLGHYIGGRVTTNSSGIVSHFNGYMANIQFIDGAALDASYFGETVEGNWIYRLYDGTSTVEGATPVSGLGGTNDKYGTNGFYLNFADESNLGKDVSGNGNDWT